MRREGAVRSRGGEPGGLSASRGYLLDFGTKAETLAQVRDAATTLVVPDFLHFTCAEWERDPDAVVGRIRDRFAGAADGVAVRSSARAEDGGQASNAGAFHSELGVAVEAAALKAAVGSVVGSFDGDPDNQVLVQSMVTDVDISGVIMTHSLDDGAPYYVINYDDETGQTDSVTGGTGAHKSVYIHRAAAEARLVSERLRRSLRLAREVEGICGSVPLDIEFAIDRAGRAILFQVRRITTTRHWLGDVEPAVNGALGYVERFVVERGQPRTSLLGRRTLFTNMSDWNPAEIIGTTPRPLASSLYRELVTRSVWREARAAMGYQPVLGEELMVLLAGQPFVDVRVSLNSFLPASVGAATGARLVDAQVSRLAENPELHDKLEFDVAATAYDFTTPEVLAERYGDALGADERDDVAAGLRALTDRALTLGGTGTLARAERSVSLLASRQAVRIGAPEDDPLVVLGRAATLLEEAREYGIRPFAVLARHAFIAESLLRSAVARGALAEDRVAAFKRSFRTVASEMIVDLAAVGAGDTAPDAFMDRYGHIRPGTYDIRSQRYADRADLFDAAGARPPELEPFALRETERRALDALVAEAAFTAVDAEGVFDYARRAIVGREYGKFVFTRNLSDALETLADWGALYGLDREQLSCLSLPAILDRTVDPVLGRSETHFHDLAVRGLDAWTLTRTIKLNYIIRGVDDLHVAPLQRAAPNFVGRRRAEGRVVELDANDPTPPDLAGAVVCIENADPGFDWIFSKNIAGLVTKYGGTNSHMAIRCAEFGLPAAIGCGELMFGDVVKAGRVELDGAHKSVRAV